MGKTTEGAGSGIRQPGQVRKEATVTKPPEVGYSPPFFKKESFLDPDG